MNFHSRKSTSIIIFLLSALLLSVFSTIITYEEYEFGWAFILSLFFPILAVWIIYSFYTTWYTIHQNYLSYKSGFIKGKIPIENIREIQVGKTMWSGLKPATATRGVIIMYNRYDEIYLSPKTNEAFTAYILAINPNIKVSYF